MDWNDLARYRWHIAAALGLVILTVWWSAWYRSYAAETTALEARREGLDRESAALAAKIAEEQRLSVRPQVMPRRMASAAASQMQPIDRLKYFLENVTRPANDLDLAYFTVTPLSPVSAPTYQEIPFSISVVGDYPALTDFLYQLEYQKDFVVRGPAVSPTQDGSVRAEFQLSALLPNDASAVPPAAGDAQDPGRPTELELARDPFTRPPAKLGTGPDGKAYFLNVPPGLRLSGTMKTGARTAAIINHEPYGVGDVIDNKTITAINDLGVEMKDAMRTYFLEMERPPYSTLGTPKEARR